MSKNLQRAETPESVGILSAEIQSMIDDMSENGVTLHSLMILRHNKVACEAYQAPLESDSSHMVYSISKSFLSAAYGFALQEEYIKKDTLFLDVFPEYAENADEKLSKLSLYHLVSMRSGKRSGMKNRRKATDWLAAFVDSPWDFAPGESFRYVSDNYYALAAALVRVTKMSITEFLTPRLYEPLGIDVPFWEKSPEGIEAGGWGLFLKTEDIAKFCMCCHNGGVFDGRAVIPKWWVKEATSKQSATKGIETYPDSEAGYGCGFWQCAGMENTYRCEGIYSQYAISFGDYDACLIMTSGCAEFQKTLDIVWKHMRSAFTEENCEFSDSVKIKIEPAFICEKSAHSPLEATLGSRTYRIKKKAFLNAIGFPVGVLPMPVVFFCKDGGGNINDVSFSFDSDGCFFSWSEDGGFKNRIYAGMNGEARIGKIKIGELEFVTHSAAVWVDEKTLRLIIYPDGAVAIRTLEFTFSKSTLKMQPDMIPSVAEKSKSIGKKLKGILKGRYFHWWIDVLVPRVQRILQPVHKGQVKKQRECKS